METLLTGVIIALTFLFKHYIDALRFICTETTCVFQPLSLASVAFIIIVAYDWFLIAFITVPDFGLEGWLSVTRRPRVFRIALLVKIQFDFQHGQP